MRQSGGLACLAHTQHTRPFARIIVKEAGKLFRHRTGQLFDIRDGHSAFIVTRHIMADTNRDQLYRFAFLDHGDHIAQVLFQIVGRVYRQSGHPSKLWW